MAFLFVMLHQYDWRTTDRPVVGMPMTKFPSSTSTSTAVGRAKEPHSTALQRDFVVNDENGGTTEFLWQIPRQPRAILFLAHGCGHDMKDWWSASNNNNMNGQELCSDCRGLPEERAIVRMALEVFHLLVVAISSLDQCWSAQDGPRVVRVLEHLQREYKLPIYALGASSGGTFVASVLARQTTSSSSLLSGYIAQIAAPHGDAVKNMPAVFITMNRDLWTDQRVSEVMEVLRADDGVPAQHIRLPPLKLERDFFASRIGEEYTDRSPAMVDALETNGLLQDGFLTQDPRKSNWRMHLAPLALKNDSLVPDQSEISEVLNCAWGMHEMTRDGVHEALSFLLTST
jgi:hypothetical protein